MMSEEEGSPMGRAVDELELQAWLGRAEFRNPSLHDPKTRGEVDALARMRDELRVQLALGKLEARKEWEQLEQRWAKVKDIAGRTAADVEESVHDLLKQIRDGYQQLRNKPTSKA
jgi:hypothetical protein